MSECIKMLVLLLLAALLTEAAFVANSSDCEDSEGELVCITSDCVKTAASFLSKLDQTVDPCEDFYQFACGSWLEKTVIPENAWGISDEYILRNNIDKTVTGLLEQEVKEDERDFIKKAKNMYASCMNLETINAQGANPLVDLIESNFQGWPLANDSWDESQFDFQEGVKNILAMNLQAFLNVYVDRNKRNWNSTQRVLYIDQPYSVVTRKILIGGQKGKIVRDAYEKLIVSTTRLIFGDSITVDRDQVREMVDFEIKLNKISYSGHAVMKMKPTMYNLTTLADLQSDYGEIVDWPSLMNDLFGVDGVNDSIADDEVIFNKVPVFFNSLKELLNKTSNRVKANFMVWQVAAKWSYQLSEDFSDIIQDYKSVVKRHQKPKSRSSWCREITTFYFQLVIDCMFKDDIFTNEFETEVNEMIDNIQAAFNEIVDELQWMNASTKYLVKEKNQHMSRYVGFPDEVANDTALSILYENYTTSADDFFDNVIGAQLELFKANLRSLRLPFVIENQYKYKTLYINAYHNAFYNSMMIPLGILQPPRFSMKYPRSINYGAIGYTIGHEITHGFDTTGRHHNKEGERVQWWNESAITNFKDKAQCMLEQYDSLFYEPANRTVDGNMTLGENIADNGGVKESFKAYRNWVAAQGKEEDKLPGLNLTHDQLFFLAFAQAYCSKDSKMYATFKIRSGKRAPDRIRVIGSLQNSEDFSEAYQCKPGSYMNPEKKCSVW